MFSPPRTIMAIAASGLAAASLGATGDAPAGSIATDSGSPPPPIAPGQPPRPAAEEPPLDLTDGASRSSAPAGDASPLRLTFATEITTAYYFRGIRQEDRGFIVQPSVVATFEAFKSDGLTVTFDAGTWNSLHDRATGAATNSEIIDKWYECDLSAGVTFAFGDWTVRPFFTWYSSPNDGFEEVYEIAWTVAYNDAGLLGPLAVTPTLTIAHEVGPNGADGPGRGAGTYLELGLTPGLDLVKSEDGSGWGLRLNFPQVLGLSLDNYYQNDAGAAQAFGFYETGARLVATAPARGRAALSMWAGVRALFLGDGARQFNRSRETVQVIGTAGLSVSF